MRVNAMTSPLPVIATVLPASNRLVTRVRAEPGTLPSPARRDLGAGRAWPAGDAVAAIENGGRRAPGRCGRFHRQPPGSFPSAATRSGGRIGGTVGDAYTAARGNWAPASRPVRPQG